jgi:hypothetical protein
MATRWMIALVIWAACSGCTTVGVTPLKNDLRPKSENCELQVFSSEKEIESPFEVVCLIDARTGTSVFHDTTGAGAVSSAKSQACKCGADAILIMSSGGEGDGFWVPKTGVANIKAIRFKENKIRH